MRPQLRLLLRNRLPLMVKPIDLSFKPHLEQFAGQRLRTTPGRGWEFRMADRRSVRCVGKLLKILSRGGKFDLAKLRRGGVGNEAGLKIGCI